MEIESCIGCPNMIVVNHPETVADLIQWNRVLNARGAEWEVERPERWEQKWLPWLIFTEVVLEQMKRGPNARVYERALVLVAEREKAGISVPEPW